MLGEIAPKIHGIANGTNLIQKIYVSVAGTSFTFSNIPNNYNYLQIVAYSRTSDAATEAGVGLRFNGDTSSNYYFEYIQGFGSTVSGGSSNQNYGQFYNTAAASTTANTFATANAYLPFYGINDGNYKSWTSSGGFAVPSGGYNQTSAGIWTNASAINSITIYDFSGGNFNVGCRFLLYGIY